MSNIGNVEKVFLFFLFSYFDVHQTKVYFTMWTGGIAAPQANAQYGCCSMHTVKGCNNMSCMKYVCDVNPYCCLTWWDASCVNYANGIHSNNKNVDHFEARAACDCNGSQVPLPPMPSPPPWAPPVLSPTTVRPANPSGPQWPPLLPFVNQGDGVSVVGSICFTLQGAANFERFSSSLSTQIELQERVANALGMWPGRLSVPKVVPRCPCGSNCPNGCLQMPCDANGLCSLERQERPELS